MKSSNLRLCALAVLLPLATAANSFASVITDIRVFASSPTGAWDGITIWDTDPAILGDRNNYNLGVYQNLTSLRAGPTDAGANVNIPLTSGTSTFEIAASPGYDHANYTLELFLDGAPQPQLSVIAPESLPNQVTGAFVANTLGGTTYSIGGMTYTIDSFQWLSPSVDNIDLVGQYTLGSDNRPDFIGLLTITTASQVASATPEPASLSLLAIGAAALLRRRKR